MELRHLRYFVTVAEELHFGRAAERLQMAQQPLSVQIRRLEEEVGAVLFNRTTRRVELTQAGRIFLEKAQQTLQLANQAIDAAREAERGERGKIEVGYVSTTLYNILPPLVRAFREAFPRIAVTLRELCSPELDELVMQGDLDVGLMGRPLQDKGLDCLTLYREPFVVVLAENHPLAAMAEIPLQALADEPFIQYDRIQKRHVHDAVVSFFHSAGVALNVVQEASNEQALVGLTAAGIGLSIVSASVASSRQTEVVYRRLIEPSVDVEFNLIWRREMPSPIIQSFIQIAQRQAFMQTHTASNVQNSC